MQSNYEKVPEMDESTLAAWLIEVSMTISDMLKNAEEQYIQKACNKRHRNLVKNRYMEAEISLDEVCSDYIGVSNSYFSSVFKKETGKPFITYLTDYRMDIAADLMVNTTDKSYTIAEKVGYPDANYFSYVFKKRFGVSTVQVQNKVSAKISWL